MKRFFLLFLICFLMCPFFVSASEVSENEIVVIEESEIIENDRVLPVEENILPAEIFNSTDTPTTSENIISSPTVNFSDSNISNTSVSTSENTILADQTDLVASDLVGSDSDIDINSAFLVMVSVLIFVTYEFFKGVFRG